MAVSTSLSHEKIVIALRDEYPEGTINCNNFFSLYVGNSLENTGFIGAKSVVFLSSENFMIHEAPACIAALLVTMVANNKISLGMAGQGAEPFPVRLFAPDQVSIMTKHLSIGDFEMLVEPEHGFVSCKKLTLSKSTEEDPAAFEMVKSWVINDDAEVETVHS